jgi:hypothetical protein
MKELIRNCQHYGNHQTCLLRGEGGDIVAVEKSSFDEDGTKAISKEAEGLKWYCQKKGRDEAHVLGSFTKSEKYCNLRIKYHDGEVIPGPVDPATVETRLENAVEHYLDVFGRDGFTFSHGDYFLRNIIYRGDAVEWVIDWEHFNTVLPAGYDAVNCVVEVFLSWRGQGSDLESIDVDTAKELLSRIVRETKLPEEVLRTPAAWCRNVALNHKNVWGAQYKKLPNVAYSIEMCAEVDRVIGQ